MQKANSLPRLYGAAAGRQRRARRPQLDGADGPDLVDVGLRHQEGAGAGAGVGEGRVAVVSSVRGRRAAQHEDLRGNAFERGPRVALCFLNRQLSRVVVKS